MADERLYEQKLTEKIKATAIASKQAKDFAALAELKDDLRAEIIDHFAHRFNISRGEAGLFINPVTGEFKPGRCMSYLLDPPELINWYKKLQETIKEMKKYPFREIADASYNLHVKTDAMNEVVMETRRVFGDDKARIIVRRARDNSKRETGIDF